VLAFFLKPLGVFLFGRGYDVILSPFFLFFRMGHFVIIGPRSTISRADLFSSRVDEFLVLRLAPFSIRFSTLGAADACFSFFSWQRAEDSYILFLPSDIGEIRRVAERFLTFRNL